MSADKLLELITTKYLATSEYHGFPLGSTGVPDGELRPLVRDLVDRGLISLHLGPHPNPHVKAFPALDAETQLKAIENADSVEGFIAYPEEKHLAAAVDQDAYAGRPYEHALALGAAELEPRFFELSVLETYRNDPRYLYSTDDQSGVISVTDEHFHSRAMREENKVLLQTFGFAYDEDMNRVVCVFVRYLANLTPEHQQVWHTRELRGDYGVHPAYYAGSILGEFPEKVSIFTAFTEELVQAQKVCAAAGLPPLVREDFEGSKPANFGFLLRPTLKELQEFHGTLDKMLSENLNKEFFKAVGVALETETTRSDGKVQVDQKGTVTLLREWLDSLPLADATRANEAVATFREVRQLRQRIAHAADDNVFDQAYVHQQRKLVVRAYRAMRTLREILETHPDFPEYNDVPDWLADGLIYTY